MYRIWDTDNRQLEKVKKYADKIKKDLSIYIDEKTQQLRNLGIELEVHQKTAKEILKRISSIEEGLGTKADEIENINKRIKGYDQVINELYAMTERVEDNLKRLHH